MAPLSERNRDRLLTIGAVAMLVGGLSLVAAATTIAWPGDPVPAKDAVHQGFEAPATCEANLEGTIPRCGLPIGMSLEALSQPAADSIAKRAVLCMDFEHGRISAEAYTAGVAALDAPPRPALPSQSWAREVLSVSSEYTADTWSSTRILGAPDVDALGNDDVNAWATLEENRGEESIRLGFAPARIGGIDIVESYNPGAVTRVTATMSNGRSQVLYSGIPGPMSAASHIRDIRFGCTEHEVVSLEITLDTSAVGGWNEIDAVAVRPCR